jgi:hypothetical protein
MGFEYAVPNSTDMRNLLFVLTLLLGFPAHSQVSKVDVDTSSSKTLKATDARRAQISRYPVSVRETPVAEISSLLGDFKVSDYYVLSTETPSDNVVNSIVGSLVNIQSNLVSGSVIETDSIQIYESELLGRSDFIYRNFGREIRAQEPGIPESLIVFKTGNLRCYGIAQLPGGKVALPYRGLLLILEPVN